MEFMYLFKQVELLEHRLASTNIFNAQSINNIM